MRYLIAGVVGFAYGELLQVLGYQVTSFKHLALLIISAGLLGFIVSILYDFLRSRK